MTNWPSSSQLIDGVVINPMSLNSLGRHMANSVSSATHAANNRAYFVPFRLASPLMVVQMFTANGGAASGNIDVGIYTLDATRIISMGSTAMSGTNAIQAFDIADTLLGPGVYYMAFCCDNTTAQFFRRTTGSLNNQLRGAGLAVQNLASVTLPTTATLAITADGTCPIFGLTGRAVI